MQTRPALVAFGQIIWRMLLCRTSPDSVFVPYCHYKSYVDATVVGQSLLVKWEANFSSWRTLRKWA